VPDEERKKKMDSRLRGNDKEKKNRKETAKFTAKERIEHKEKNN